MALSICLGYDNLGPSRRIFRSDSHTTSTENVAKDIFDTIQMIPIPGMSTITSEICVLLAELFIKIAAFL